MVVIWNGDGGWWGRLHNLHQKQQPQFTFRFLTADFCLFYFCITFLIFNQFYFFFPFIPLDCSSLVAWILLEAFNLTALQSTKTYHHWRFFHILFVNIHLLSSPSLYMSISATTKSGNVARSSCAHHFASGPLNVVNWDCDFGAAFLVFLKK